MKLPKKYAGITPGEWGVKFARLKLKSPIFGFSITSDKRLPPIASSGVVIEHAPLVAPEFRHIVTDRYTEPEMEANAEIMADFLAASAAVLADREVLKRIDDAWTRDFPGGPDSPEMIGGFGRLSEETIETWKLIRARLASTKEWEA